MKDARFNQHFQKSFLLQIITVWTVLVLAVYFIHENWLQNNLPAFALLWAVGILGLQTSIRWRWNNLNDEEKDFEARKISNLIYHAVMNTSTDSIAVVDPFGNYIFANKQTAILHGYSSSEEFIGVSAFKFFSLDEVARAIKYMEMTRADGVIRNIEFNLLRKDGSTFPAELSAALVKNELGLPVAFIAVTRDITERKRITDQLRDVNEQLRKQLGEIEKLQSILREQAIQDPLTGLYNRRYMEEVLKQEFARASREGKPFSIVMLDLDNLKTLNDTHGHVVGDEALKLLARQIKRLTRIEDTACRYGGDEFLVILHNADEMTAQKRIEELTKRIQEVRITSVGEEMPISFSAGSATYPRNGDTVEQVIQFADTALYNVKASRKKPRVTSQ